jgi:hypothetical protein
MRLPRFWIKASCSGTTPEGEPLQVDAWGWSRDSAADAEAVGLQRARKGLERLLKNRDKGPASDYDYLDLPMREEIVEELGPPEQPLGAITRNRSGALILNTASVLFADVDFPPPKANGFWDAIVLLFSAERRAERAEEARQAAVASVKTWISRNPQRTLRLYRTAAGMRLLFTDRLYQPTSDDTLALLHELGSDKLYIRLTRKQESFRARLTPKPRRCGQPHGAIAYPFASPAEEEKARIWRRDYEQKCAGFRVCDLVTVSGRDSQDPAIKAVVDLHDRYTCQPRTGKLA